MAKKIKWELLDAETIDFIFGVYSEQKQQETPGFWDYREFGWMCEPADWVDAVTEGFGVEI